MIIIAFMGCAVEEYLTALNVWRGAVLQTARWPHF
jgi:hypothetical protein